MTSPTKDNPIKLFQFWDNPEPPNEVLKVMRTWKNHKGIRVHLFDEKKARQFIKRKLGEKVVKAFNTCAIPAMKADFFRYCALYVQGGIYVDADISLRKEMIKEFRELLADCNDGIIMTREKAVANDFIFIKEANHPLIKKTLDKAIQNINDKKSNNVWEVTGPGIMTEFFIKANKELFDNFRMTSFKEIREIVEFKWKMSYKKGDGHWTNAQEKKSIFNI